MTEAAAPVPIAGVAMTAIGIAVVRVRETERDDRLYSDPFAHLFVDAAMPSFGARWDELSPLLDMFYEARTVAVRLVDDHVEAAVREGVRQIVILGAGLDTRAFRMDLPADTRFFELDLPETFAFKEPVLTRGGVTPRYERRVLPVDLRGDWAEALLAQGFRADEPTLWVDEGVLGYLLRPDARQVLATLTELSAPRSRFDIGNFAVDPNSGAYLVLRRLVSGADEVPREVAGLGSDIEQWLHEHGWDTTFQTWAEQAASVGRPDTNGGPETGNIVAIRR
ncbi:SAM-dependent methyltransferase [Nocardia sp. NBC_01503]|uniref:SAM-dependent methyltransferase n=1 Tax=Nocardia sp. NBC_01503 TaxID=2975997 RepID=UPI002E7B2087|nr:SAM-dependent methyltransferase [Nocardia sp. NBC_01503]WTL32990.1 SAM-dependent methyltransferase [Nocardia sp. NBC_01503]